MKELQLLESKENQGLFIVIRRGFLEAEISDPMVKGGG